MLPLDSIQKEIKKLTVEEQIRVKSVYRIISRMELIKILSGCLAWVLIIIFCSLATYAEYKFKVITPFFTEDKSLEGNFLIIITVLIFTVGFLSVKILKVALMYLTSNTLLRKENAMLKAIAMSDASIVKIIEDFDEDTALLIRQMVPWLE